jgi:hypothetical protein
MSTSTPWGPSQTSHRISRGVTLYTTARHGGLHVSPTVLKTFPEPYRSFQSVYAPSNWYEEDCDWAIPVCARPDLPWPKSWLRHAFATLHHYHFGLYQAATPNWEGYP